MATTRFALVVDRIPFGLGADQGCAGQVGALQQTLQGQQRPRLPRSFLTVDLLEAHDVRAQPDDLRAHQGDPLVQRRVLPAGVSSKFSMLNVAIRTVVTALPPRRKPPALRPAHGLRRFYSRSAVGLLPTATQAEAQPRQSQIRSQHAATGPVPRHQLA